jgi:hypothetical protein
MSAPDPQWTKLAMRPEFLDVQDQVPGDVRFGSEADMCAAKRHVRFTPNSDRKSGHSTVSAIRRVARKAFPTHGEIHLFLRVVQTWMQCQVGRTVEDRTSLRTSSPQNGNFSNTDRRLSVKTASSELIAGISETVGSTKTPLIAGFSVVVWVKPERPD